MTVSPGDNWHTRSPMDTNPSGCCPSCCVRRGAGLKALLPPKPSVKPSEAVWRYRFLGGVGALRAVNKLSKTAGAAAAPSQTEVLRVVAAQPHEPKAGGSAIATLFKLP